MPKHEPMTAKAIGKRIKSKGLQKLKYFCQMCQKQCRDENGFKCHSSSESHQRQLLLFAENPHKYMDAFSQEFLKDFLHLLKTRFGTRRVPSNQVYQEYIKEKDHLHMNATRWVTLTGFVKWLGRKGICIVDNNERGWFMTYVDRDPETLLRNERKDKKAKLEKDYEERMAKIIEEQIERGKEQSKPGRGPEEALGEGQGPSELKKENEEQKVSFALPPPKLKDAKVASASVSTAASSSAINGESYREQPIQGNKGDNERDGLEKTRNGIKRKKSGGSERVEKAQNHKKSNLETIIDEEEKAKAKRNCRDYWLTAGIVVKIVANKLGDKYYKKKGVVESVENKYTGIVKMLESGDKLRLDQEYLETVIPQKGRMVRVVNGVYVGCEATLLDVNFDKFCCKIRIESGPTRGRVIEGIKYEEISKIN